MPISLFPPLLFNAKSDLKFSNFCTEMPVSSIPPPDRGVATVFLLNKYGLTDEDITKAFRDRNGLLHKSSQNLEDVSELLNECGSTTQIRRVVLKNPRFLLYKSERNPKATMSFLRVFMEEKVIAKLVYSDSETFSSSEDKLKSVIVLLQRLGTEGDALSESVARQLHLLATSAEKVMESFKLAEDLGFSKRSKMFTDAVGAILGIVKENLDGKLRCLSNLGFSEKQISDVRRGQPWILGLSEEKLKNNVDVLVSYAGISLDDLAQYPSLLGYGLERMTIPRYRVTEALKSMQVLKTEMGFPRVVNLSERRFLEKGLNSNAKSSSVLQDVYRGGKAGKLIISRETYSECVSVKKIQENCGISSLAPSSIHDRSIVTDFLIDKCGSTEQDIAKASRLCNDLRRGKSGQKLEEVLELLNGCGSTVLEQIQRVVLGNPTIFLYKYKRNLKSRISFLMTFMKKEDFPNSFILVQRFLMSVRIGLNLRVHSCKDWVLRMTCYQN
jgi:mTERF domain-containing protein